MSNVPRFKSRTAANSWKHQVLLQSFPEDQPTQRFEKRVAVWRVKVGIFVGWLQNVAKSLWVSALKWVLNKYSSHNHGNGKLIPPRLVSFHFSVFFPLPLLWEEGYIRTTWNHIYLHVLVYFLVKIEPEELLFSWKWLGYKRMGFLQATS